VVYLLKQRVTLWVSSHSKELRVRRPLLGRVTSAWDKRKLICIRSHTSPQSQQSRGRKGKLSSALQATRSVTMMQTELQFRCLAFNCASVLLTYRFKPLNFLYYGNASKNRGQHCVKKIQSRYDVTYGNESTSANFFFQIFRVL